MAKDDWRSSNDMDEYAAKWRASHSEGETPSRIPRMWISYGTRQAPAVVTSAATWSSADKNASVAITGSGLIATCGGSAGVNRGGRGTTATTAVGAGVNRFWKVVATTAGANFGIGFCTSSQTFADADFLGDAAAQSIGWFPNGDVYYNGSVLTTGPTYVQGNTLMIACQGGGSGKFWLGVGSTWSGDPAAGTGGINNGFATVYPAYNLRLNDVATASFALSDAPSGFSIFP